MYIYSYAVTVQANIFYRMILPTHHVVTVYTVVSEEMMENLDHRWVKDYIF